MMGTTHMVFGTVLAIGAGKVLGWDSPSMDSIVYYASGILGSLLPDIDHPRSLIGRNSLGISNIINKLGGHRGFTHYAVSGIMVALGSWILLKTFPLSMGLLVGYSSHILGDMMTKSGVPAYGPFSKKRIRLPLTFRTNSVMEVVIFCACISFIFLYQWWHL